MKQSKNNKKEIILITLLVLILVFAFFCSFDVGRYSHVNMTDIYKILMNKVVPIFSKTWTDADEAVILNLRLPRIIISIFVGSSLALAGTTYQSLFANPIASPDTLGVSNAASFGAVLAMIFGMGMIKTKILSFVVGCIAVMLVFYLAKKLTRGHNMTVYLLLIGMVVSSMFSAFLSILKFIADPENQLPQITYWLMGSFSKVSNKDIPFVISLYVFGSIPLYLLRWRMNLLSLSESESKSLGENSNFLRGILVFSATLLTATSTALTGGINWIGLIIPHITRQIVGNDNRKIIPISSLFGAVFLLIMDNLARSLSINEIPISVLTSLVGAPVFLVILIKNRKGVVNDN